jgi:ribose 5-phosphate isomerase B
MPFSEEEVKAMVRRVLLQTLGPDGIEAQASSREERTNPTEPRGTVTETDVLAVPRGGQLALSRETLITPLARDTARERQVELVQEPDAAMQSKYVSSPDSGRKVALGADHGGYALKEELKADLAELGYAVLDCGTHSAASVDYPDFAYAVALLVSEGRAWRGIIIDGAGIGSCMAANKVPGVRAAMCYDHATAVNSREHNDANVLSLGGMLLGSSLARQIVKVWLETDFGGGRHARRVDKIMGIEQRFLGG